MPVIFKNLSTSDLNRPSARLVYVETDEEDGPPPSGCNAQDIVPVTCVFQDFNLPNGVINSTWSPITDDVFSNDDGLSISSNQLLMFNPTRNSVNALCAAYDTSFTPATGPQISRITWKGAVLPGAPIPPPVQAIGVGCAVSVRMSGGPNFSQFQCYTGVYQELYSNSALHFGQFQGSFAIIQKWIGGVLIQQAGTGFVSGTTRANIGDVLQLNVNDDIGGARLTCLRFLNNGVSMRAMNDTSFTRILSGTPGIGPAVGGYNELAGTLSDDWAGCTATL